MMRLALDLASAWASVLATTKSTPCRPAAIMLLTALPPAPPTPNTVRRAFISRISVMLVIVASRLLEQAGNERTRVATYKPCGLLPLWSRLDVPIGVRLVLGRSPLGHRSAGLPARLQAVPSPPSRPASRQSSEVAPSSGGLRARVRARSLPDDSPPLFRAARSPPAMSRFLSLAERCCLPGECLGVGACAVSQRDRRSPGLCRPACVSVAIRLA